jgi:GNAT superfamily N-acetyltransferase
VTSALPTGWTIRHPTLADGPDILAMVHASDIAAVGEADFTADEVRAILTSPNFDPVLDSWVALDDAGRLMGWAYLMNPARRERENLDVYVHPEHGRPAQGVLLDLALARVAGRARGYGRPQLTVHAGAIGTETHYCELLVAAGFRFLKRAARMAIALAGDERLPDLPAGLSIRLVRPDDDADLRTFQAIIEAAFADVPGNLPTSYESYRQMLAAMPSIAWDEWFVAELDGVPVGVLQSSDQGVQDNEGWVKSLAVAKEHRGQGIGGALLRTALATYAGKGRSRAGLGVDLTNPTNAYRLYESVGLRPSYEADIYERIVAAAPKESLGYDRRARADTLVD